MSRKSSKVALGGIVTALCIVTMLLTALVPFATFALPGLAGVFLAILVIELGPRWALAGYVSSSLLALLLVPDKEAVFIYIFLLGIYPILKAKFESAKNKVTSYVLKFAFFNSAVLLCYVVLIFVFQLGSVVAEFAEFTPLFLGGLLIFANITFFCYDIALSQCIKLYVFKLRDKIIRPH